MRAAREHVQRAVEQESRTARSRAEGATGPSAVEEREPLDHPRLELRSDRVRVHGRVCTLALMAVLNVRLAPEDQRLAQDLRDEGVELSGIVRDAIRTEHARRIGKRARRPKPSAVVRALIEAHPAPVGSRPTRPDPRDRRAVQAFVAATLRKSPGR